MQIDIAKEQLKIFTLALELGIKECDRIGLEFKTDELKEMLEYLEESTGGHRNVTSSHSKQ